MNDAAPRIWTIGHTSRTAEELRALLAEHAITLLLDVRSSPWSRRHPWHGRDELESSLKAAGIEYRWMGSELGGLREEGFEAHRASDEYQAALRELLQAAERPAALFCAERDYRHCHRRWIAEDLVARGARVWHILDSGELVPHQLSLDLSGEL